MGVMIGQLSSGLGERENNFSASGHQGRCGQKDVGRVLPLPTPGPFKYSKLNTDHPPCSRKVKKTAIWNVSGMNSQIHPK